MLANIVNLQTGDLILPLVVVTLCHPVGLLNVLTEVVKDNCDQRLPISDRNLNRTQIDKGHVETTAKTWIDLRSSEQSQSSSGKGGARPI